MIALAARHTKNLSAPRLACESHPLLYLEKSIHSDIMGGLEPLHLLDGPLWPERGAPESDASGFALRNKMDARGCPRHLKPKAARHG